ncbi:M4 family metallopeptidase [Nocardioides bigeumensis]|uniref:Neutral metalloproteinase n=1 Tax=Nocardioides bigeumensis TaxID=433657 RepID=A0ABP5K542_9ACTN
MASRDTSARAATCGFVPPYLLRHLAASDPGCARTLELDHRLRDARAGRLPRTPGPTQAGAAAEAWVVFSADNRETLPGHRVRSSEEPTSGDVAVDEAAAGLEASLALAADLGRASYDGGGGTVRATVHYGRSYVNAFWNGDQLVFGDGDGRVFERFTKSVDVLAHEFAHAVTEFTAGLVYRDQPGALNESVSDVFAVCLKQRLLGQTASQGDWLIGAELFRPGVRARALRDMAAPGTAYDDPELGRDPQVGHLDDYVVTQDDNGGVHLNSGIPNRAFHLAATAIGGTSWEGAGRVWWQALTEGAVRASTGFGGFAAATMAAAGAHADAVRSAWAAVGVEPGRAVVHAPASSVEADPAALVVRRSGGFLGRTEEARCDLTRDDPVAIEALDLMGRVDLSGTGDASPLPDSYVYTFELPGRPPVTVPEQQLSPELARLAALVLGR